jgi:hypothetical protein
MSVDWPPYQLPKASFSSGVLLGLWRPHNTEPAILHVISERNAPPIRSAPTYRPAKFRGVQGERQEISDLRVLGTRQAQANWNLLMCQWHLTPVPEPRSQPAR